MRAHGLAAPEGVPRGNIPGASPFPAARLARLGITGGSTKEVCRELPEDFVASPDPSLVDCYAERIVRFRALYRALRNTFQEDPR